MKKPINSLFWKVSLTFLGVFLILSTIYVTLTVHMSSKFFQETHQQLNRSIAEHIAQDVIFQDGIPDKRSLKQLFHHTMVLNPNLEIYFLATQGNILVYYAPTSKVHLKAIDPSLLETFLVSSELLRGPDPRNPQKTKIFSTARLYDQAKEKIHKGYIYVILGSEEYDSIAEQLSVSYILKTSISIMGLTMFFALFVGMWAIWYWTSSFQDIVFVLQKFQEGDTSIRMPTSNDKDFSLVTKTFNEMSETISKNVTKIRSMEKLRRELIANVSHDLRTPLCTMRGYVETLLMKENEIDSETRRQYLTTTLRGTQKLQHLVEQLFELSKLEAKEVSMQKEAFSLTDLVQDTAKKYKMLAMEKEISLETHFDQNLPRVFGDIAHIDRVFQNLIDNSIKFSPLGGTISIELEQKNHRIYVSVSDTGKGIPKNELPYIFDSYQMGTRKNTIDNTSSGLGLAIVKKILESHESTITADSTLNRGTRFTFFLPLA